MLNQAFGKNRIGKIGSRDEIKEIRFLLNFKSVRKINGYSTDSGRGGNACIRNTRIPVWTLVSRSEQGATDSELLEDYPSLIQTDLEAAWIYYQHHKDEIDQAIAAQDDED